MSGRIKALLAALLLVFSVVPFLGAATGASAAIGTPARATQSDVAGFPLWYQDVNGVRVQPCIDPNDPNCTAPISATYDPTKPLAFPGNYPDEFFYSAVDSQGLIVADCASNPVANPGVTVHLALEGAFINGTLTPGDQMVFGRIRVTAKAGSGLCPNTYYTIRTPYGPVTVQTDGAGNIAGGVAASKTIDVGCLPGPTKPCNFDLALASRHLSVGLLRQVNNAAAGYLGSGPGFDAITGGLNGINSVEVLKWNSTPPATGLDQDCVDCTSLGSTNQFLVSAKLAGPLSSSVSSLDLGGVALATTKTGTITLTNLGSGPLGLDPTTIDSITVSGANAADFTPTTTSCPVIALNALAGQIARDATCDVTVQFTAASTTKETASLDVTMNGGTQVLHIPLVATGLAAGAAPAMTVDPVDGNLALGPVRVTNVSAVKNVTITNSGTAPLQVTPAIVPSADSAAFALVTNNCTVGFLDAGASCTVGVQFTPAAVKSYTALLDLANNAGTTFAVALTGNGTGGIAAVGPVNPVNTQPEWYQDEFGTRVGQCDDPSNPLCITAIPSGTAVFPTNYPSEWFYYIAQSTPIDVSDPACGLVGRQMFVTAAVESAFLGQIAPNLGTTFGRLRVVSHGGLCPNKEYLITHPYGQIVLATDGNGNIKPKAGTTDVGCLGAPCDFSIALSAPQFERFLQQTVHPAGYLGNPLAPSTVTGAPYTDPLTGQPANLFRIQTVTNGVADATLATTDQFTVSGRLVGPMVATPAATNFGSAEVNVGSVTSTVTHANAGIATVTLQAPALTIDGAAAADYSITATTCTDGAQLIPGASCTADVTFAPKAAGTRDAALTLHHDGMNDPLAAMLTGIGTSANGTAAISSSLASVKFTDQHVGTNSASEVLTISNVGGSADLLVSSAAVTAGAPFTVTSNTCQNPDLTSVAVLPNATCAIGVHFNPTVTGTFTANLTITSNAASGTLTIPLSGTSVNFSAAQASTTTVAGFPTWFQDTNGVRLEQCLAQDQNCVLLADPGFNPANPIAWPGNYPLESFYGLADSQIMTIEPQVCANGEVTAGGLAQTRLATEATFAGVTQATAGANTWFNRIRVTASGLCAGTTYQFVTPYGTFAYTTDAAGGVKPKVGTFDNPNVIGSAPVNPAVLVWDPNYATAPAGYIGDARTYQKVVGGRNSLGGEPVNYFRIVSPTGGTVGQVDKFIVAGRIAGPLTSNPSSKDFGSLLQGQTSPTTTITITNVTNAPIGSIVVSSSSTLFPVTTSCPTGAGTLAANTSCTVSVQFKPTTAAGAGLKTATISVGYNGLRSPLTIPVSGTSVAPSTSAITVSPTSLSFGNVAVGATSTTQSVTIKNSGTGSLALAGTLTGTNPGQYAVTGTTCPAAGLAAGGSCTITVAFKPTSTGSKPATLAITGTAPGSTTVLVTSNVSLSGTGAQGTISVAGTLSIAGQAGRTSTGRLTLTNTGTAPFSLTGAPFWSFTAISANNPVPMYSASQTGCNNVAPGKNCTVTVSFAPPPGTPVGTYSAQLSMTSNASNNPVKVTVTGTLK